MLGAVGVLPGVSCQAVFPIRAANRAILPVLWRDPVLRTVAPVSARSTFTVIGRATRPW